MAHALSADYIEQDVQLSRDGVPVVRTITIWMQYRMLLMCFRRGIGRWYYYVVDFTFAFTELTLKPRVNDSGGVTHADFGLNNDLL